MAASLPKLYDEIREFNRMESCAEKIELAISRLENPYNLTDDERLAYQDYLTKDAIKVCHQFIDANRIAIFPLLVKHRVIRKANINKLVDYAQENRKMDILSYLLETGNNFRNHPKKMDIAPKFVPGKSANDEQQVLPSAENVKAGDIIWLGKKPMPWLVLDKKDNQIMVISKYAFDCQAYNNTFYKMKLENSAVYKWLNGDFYKLFFNDEEKNIIAGTYIDDEDRLHTVKIADKQESKLFLLSVDEAKKYFPEAENRRARITLHGKRKVMWVSFDVYAHWWLRTPSLDKVAGESHVDYTGEIQRHGGTVMSNGYDVFYDHYGVRPAMHLTLE